VDADIFALGLDPVDRADVEADGLGPLSFGSAALAAKVYMRRKRRLSDLRAGHSPHSSAIR
jgi:hypothetical protein